MTEAEWAIRTLRDCVRTYVPGGLDAVLTHSEQERIRVALLVPFPPGALKPEWEGDPAHAQTVAATDRQIDGFNLPDGEREWVIYFTNPETGARAQMFAVLRPYPAMRAPGDPCCHSSGSSGYCPHEPPCRPACPREPKDDSATRVRTHRESEEWTEAAQRAAEDCTEYGCDDGQHVGRCPLAPQVDGVFAGYHADYLKAIAAPRDEGTRAETCTAAERRVRDTERDAILATLRAVVDRGDEQAMSAARACLASYPAHEVSP